MVIVLYLPFCVCGKLFRIVICNFSSLLIKYSASKIDNTDLISNLHPKTIESLPGISSVNHFLKEFVPLTPKILYQKFFCFRNNSNFTPSRLLHKKENHHHHQFLKDLDATAMNLWLQELTLSKGSSVKIITCITHCKTPPLCHLFMLIWKSGVFSISRPSFMRIGSLIMHEHRCK